MALAPTSRLHWAGTYDQALDYAAGTVVLQGGGLYRARLPRPHGATAPADDAASWDTLVAAPALRGPHDRSGAYAPRDVVTDAQGLYTCTSPVGPETRVDTFERPDQAGWGTATDGHVWGYITGAEGTAESIEAHAGLSGPDDTHHRGENILGSALSGPDVEVLCAVTFSAQAIAGGTTASVWLRWRADDAAAAFVNLDPLNSSVIRQVYGDPDFAVDNAPGVSVTFAADQRYWVRFRAHGTLYSWRVWADGTGEPTAWTQSLTSTIAYGAGYVGLQSGGAAHALRFDHFSATALAPAPADDHDHWTALAPAPAQAGTPVLYGPFTVDVTDFGPTPMEGHKKDLWTPAVGDVLLRLFCDWHNSTPPDQGAYYIGQNVDGTTSPPHNTIESTILGNMTAQSVQALDTITAQTVTGATDASGAPMYATTTFFHSTDPVQIQLAQTGGTDPGSGHVELYALVARAIAP